MKVTFLSDKESPVIKNSECFSEDSLRQLQEIMYEHTYTAGSYLFWEGDRSEKLYYVKNGHVRITKSTDDGKEFILNLFAKGDLFGEVGSYSDDRYSYNAEAVDDCVIGVMQSRDLEVLLWRHGEIAVEFMKWMGMMHRITQTKFRDLMLYGKPETCQCENCPKEIFRM